MGLTTIFGDRPIPKILDFFRVNQFWDYSLKDVQEGTGVSYRTLQSIIQDLVKKGILVFTRTEGKAKMYQFNPQSEPAKKIQDLAIEFDIEYGKRIAGIKDRKTIPSIHEPIPA